jgi:hypothetical protein
VAVAGELLRAALDGELLRAALLDAALDEDAPPRASACSVAALMATALLAINARRAIRTFGRRMGSS